MWRAGREWLAGSVLVFVGALLLAEQRMPALVPLIPLVVGLLVLLLCLVRRSPSALLIGCVLTGAGVGVLVDRAGTEVAGAAFLACVALGFGVAWLLALVMRIRGLRLWPLVGAAIAGGMAALVAITGRGEELRRVAVAWWPVAVIALGLALLVDARARRRGHGPDEETRMVQVVRAPPDGRR